MRYRSCSGGFVNPFFYPRTSRGPNFIALPELFDKINDEVEDYVDEIADRPVELRGAAEGAARMREPT